MRGYLLAYAIAVAFIIIGKRLLFLPPVKVLGPAPLTPVPLGTWRTALIWCWGQAQTKHLFYYRGTSRSRYINV